MKSRRKGQHVSEPKTQRWSKRPGTAPGTLEIPPEAAKPELHVFTYGPAELEEHHPRELGELEALLGKHDVTWIDVQGLGDADLLQGLGERFGLHPLALEDAVIGHHPAKAELFDDHVFVVVRMAEPDVDVGTSQVSVFVKQGMVLTLRESATDPFEPLRERLRRGGPRLRNRGADYLAYALIDSLIDGYFPILESYGDILEELEDRILEAPDEAQLGELHLRRRELVALRKASWPHRDAIQELLREPPPPFTAATQVFLRDCYDHTLRIIDLLETYREQTSSLMEVYLSSIGQRTNEVMKVLTVIATLFMPLGFLAGLYGMNFDTRSPWNMPELAWPYSYPVLLGLMACVAGGFVWYFRRKGWF